MAHPAEVLYVHNMGGQPSENASSQYLVGWVPDTSGDDALALARLFGASSGQLDITVCTVVPQTATGGDAAFGGVGYGDLLARKLDVVYQQARQEFGEIAARYVVRMSPSVSTGLLDFAAEIDASMLVIGSHGGSARGRHVVGGIGGALQHASPLPLAFAPDGFASAEVDVLSRITCGYNDSPDSQAALDTAVDLCRLFRTPLRLVTFVFPEFSAWRNAPALAALKSPMVEVVAIAEKRLAAVAVSLPGDVRVQTQVCSGGNIAQAVARADWPDGELLVLGSAPMGPLSRVFLGSTSLKLLRICPSPVVAVPRGASVVQETVQPASPHIAN